MTRFTATQETWGGYDTVLLVDHQRDLQVRIARHGATLLSLSLPVAGTRRELADGYRDAAELQSRPSSRFAIMAPFANRIADARYGYDGQTYDMQPGVEGAQRAARHGFVRGVDFAIDQVQAGETKALAVFATTAIRGEDHPGYPHAIDLEVHYTLDARGLSLEAVMRNVGDDVAPCFFGWHPYFRIADSALDGWELHIPARKLIRVDAAAIPLDGEAAYAPVASEPALDFSAPRAIGDVKLDQGYADLVADADGRVRTRLRDPASGLSLNMWQTHGVVLAFTADTVTRDVRRAIALEPMESMTNAYNRADCAEAIRLQPGTERRFICGIELELP